MSLFPLPCRSRSNKHTAEICLRLMVCKVQAIGTLSQNDVCLNYSKSQKRPNVSLHILTLQGQVTWSYFFHLLGSTIRRIKFLFVIYTKIRIHFGYCIKSLRSTDRCLKCFYHLLLKQVILLLLFCFRRTITPASLIMKIVWEQPDVLACILSRMPKQCFMSLLC